VFGFGCLGRLGFDLILERIGLVVEEEFRRCTAGFADCRARLLNLAWWGA
jgi:hypothetical protein